MSRVGTGRPRPRLPLALYLGLWAGAFVAQGIANSPPDDALVAKGRYLAALGNCAACHTRSNGPPFGGGVAFPIAVDWSNEPLGTLYSSNISPDPETGIGEWTLADFSRAMRDGVSRSGKHLYPVFPYTAFAGLSGEDMAAIFAYIRWLAPVRYRPPENDLPFPINWRGSLAVWKWLYADRDIHRPDDTRSAEWNRGAYLVRTLGHCGACHSPRNLLLANIPDRALSGGTLFHPVSQDKVRLWAAVNLTPASTGLGAWSRDDIASYLRIGHSPKAGSFGPMDRVIGEGTRHLTEDDALAMAAYLKSLLPIEGEAAAVPAPRERELGLALYTEHCEDCHMASGRGNFFKAPPLAGSAVAQAPSPLSLINIVLYGATVPDDVPAPYPLWEDMVPYRDKLSDAEVANLGNYVRNAWGNRGGPITAEDVARQR